MTMVATNSDKRTYEYTISFTPDQMTRIDGGLMISGCNVKFACPRQHRHENPSSYRKRKKKDVRRLLNLRDWREWSQYW